ncbi:hypothetical protein [Brevibacterium moorei]|uniref:hypothetical protein n=1 Tax=Brevibacterium moorei TaxID=2968457 RepID=UPI00211BA5B8|nr:hypothetical protein [Brevibacterium sp. 68QC2CO]MCQ9384447.1 hypothetical protein [Brevibacterium sp. 68QC2CO]
MEAALVEKIAGLRRAFKLPADELPDPAPVLDAEPAIESIGDWPCVFCAWTTVDQKDVDLRAPESGVLTESYEFRYTVRVYALVRHTSRQTTERQARLYEQAVRAVVLERRDITPEWITTEETIVIDPTRVSAEPWDVMPDGNNRFISAVYVEFPITADEQVGSPFPSMGRAADIPVAAVPWES